MLEVIFAKLPKFFPKNLSLEVLSLYFVSALLCAKFGQNATKLAIFLSCDNKAWLNGLKLSSEIHVTAYYSTTPGSFDFVVKTR